MTFWLQSAVELQNKHLKNMFKVSGGFSRLSALCWWNNQGNRTHRYENIAGKTKYTLKKTKTENLEDLKISDFGLVFSDFLTSKCLRIVKNRFETMFKVSWDFSRLKALCWWKNHDNTTRKKENIAGNIRKILKNSEKIFRTGGDDGP